MPGVALLWYRRDLRLHDHAALQAALASGASIVPVYVLDLWLLDGR
jgi:deoxyribodipyrimidine photo-lyase